MPVSTVSPDIGTSAVALRQSHPAASARDVLDLVMRGRSGVVDAFGPALRAGGPFALLVAEAFDGVDMMPAWLQWSKAGTDPALERMLQQRWDCQVLPRFAAAYGLVCDTTPAPSGLGAARGGRCRRAAA